MTSAMTTEPPPATPPANPPATPPATATQPPATAAQPPATQPAAEAQPPAGQANPQVVKQHLTAARDALAQLTQLPQAAQLAGDARTQVSQLITNFNSLISAKDNWGEEYKKVDANLTALIGNQTTDEAPVATSGTAGAVGTSGTVTLDPAIRAKLVELRTHLTAFNKAAGGGAPAVSSTPDPAAASATPPTSPEKPTSPENPPSAGDPADGLKHLAAIEAILGTQAGASAGITLDRTQMEQLRTHMSELKRILSKGGEK
jgi:hypothetical protein